MKNFSRQLTDFFFVIRGLWLLLFVNALAFFAFGVTSQGPDVLLCIVEDFHGSALHSSMTFFSLFVGLVFWSVTSEFAARMTIYMSDNSGHQLSDERVEKRKIIQHKIVRASLLLPSFSMVIGFIRALIINWIYIDAGTKFVFILIILVLSLLPVALYKCYYGKAGDKLVKKWPFLALDEEMKNWAGKLYGIFSDVILSVRLVNDEKPEDLSREDIRRLTGREIPEAFGKPIIEPDTDGENIWWFTFKIPLSFYKKLLRQFLALSIISISLVLTFAFLRGPYYEHIGTAGLLAFAFASWPMLYVFLNFLDKAQPLRVKLPYRFLVLLYIIFCSIANDGHPARVICESNALSRPSLQQHFENWYKKLEAKYESSQHTDTLFVKNSPGDSSYRRVIRRQELPDTIPVVFVAAEGGAFRSGAYAAMMLAELQDSFPQFKDHIYAYSTVSGGTVGANVFQSMGRLNMNKRYDTAAYEFFKQDYLSALAGKLVFGELLNCFWPCHADVFDRQIALEEGWEDGWKGAVTESDPGNYLRGSFDQNFTDGPALFINTMEVESGLQCVWSNVRVPAFPYQDRRDLLGATNLSLPYTTAIGLSARFPLISPSGKIVKTGKHYVDGGYFENKGQETLLQVLQSLDFSKLDHPVKIYVIQFNFGEDAEEDTKPPGLSVAGGLSDILKGIYNTRSGRGYMAQYHLKQFMAQNRMEFVNLSPLLNGKLFPMDWVLSNSAMERMRESCMASARLQKKDKKELMKLKFLYGEK
jgi:hypothetical protein